MEIHVYTKYLDNIVEMFHIKDFQHYFRFLMLDIEPPCDFRYNLTKTITIQERLNKKNPNLSKYDLIIFDLF